MKILFVHQNFPAQFKFLAPALAEQGHEVSALVMRAQKGGEWNGVRMFSYMPKRATTENVHPWVRDFETKTIRGEACLHMANELKQQGYSPDLIIAHPGWGESMFLKDVWTQAKLGIYCEFFYNAEGADVGFDPEFPMLDVGEPARMRLKNMHNLLQFDVADAGISPTHWQASTFPAQFRHKIEIIHDGIDTDALVPDPMLELTINKDLTLTRSDEVVTFVNRNLEPYRGYHTFMRALPHLLKRRPNARVLLVGGNDVSYGARHPSGRSWKDIFIDEVRPQISDAEWARVHFLGNLPYEHFIPLLQLSTVHVYLTYPFVLSWSLLEAMSVGCAIVASDTQPLREAIRHGETGRLFDFFDPQALADEVVALLDSPAERERLGRNARRFAQENYDLKTICLPRQLEWVARLLPKNDDQASSGNVATTMTASDLPTFLHVGCGPKRKDQTTRGFNSPGWNELRFDIDESVKPDLVGTMLDMSSVASESVDAIYSSHNIEHLYVHELPVALAEFLRVLKPGGFFVVTCPDLQSVCKLVAEDQLDDAAYDSPAGPITPLDILYGYGRSMAAGNLYMAHRSGFTQKTLMRTLQANGFVTVATAARGYAPYFDLWAVATKSEVSEAAMRSLAEQHFPK